MRSRYFNWKLAIVILLGFIVLGVTAFGLRQWQRGRRAQSGFTLGNAAYKKYQWDEAAKQLGRYIAVAPDDTGALLKYADAQLNIRPGKQGNLQQAVAAYRNVLRLEPNNVEAAVRLCEIYTSLNMPAEVELIASRTLQAGDSPELRKALALALAGQRKYDEAIKKLKSEIEKNPDQVYAYELLALLIEQRPTEFSEEPTVWLNLAIKNNPRNAEALIARAAFFLRQARTDEAMTDLTQAQQLDLSEPVIRFRLIEQLLDAGDLANARKHLEIAGRMQPDNILVWKLWARLAILSNSKDLMAQTADNALKSLLSQPWDFMPTATELFIRAGQFDKAQECISNMRKNDIAPAMTTFLEGLLADSQGRLQDSVKYWRQAMDMGLKFPSVRISLANALWRIGDAQSAINLMRTLISEQPELFNARIALAQLLINSGHWAEAEQQVVAARRISPNNGGAALLQAKIRLRLLAVSNEDTNSSQYQDIKTTLDKLEKISPVIDIKLLQFNMAIQQNDLSSANKLLADLKKAYPADVRVPLAEADLLTAQNRTDDAIAALQKANVSFPRNPSVIRHLSVLLAAKDRLGDCEALIKNAFDSETKLPLKKEFGLMLSDIYNRWGQNSRRYALLNSLAEQLKDDIGIWRELLGCEEVIKNTNRARQIVDKIKNIEGDDGWQWRYEQARILFREQDFKNKYPQIVSLLQENLLTNPDDVSSRILLGMACEKAGDQRLAVSTYSEALARAPGDVRIMAQAASAFYRTGEYDKVEDILRKAAREKLYHPDLERVEFQGALRRGNLSLANDILEKMLERDPNNLLTGLSLAMLKIRQDNLPAALQLVQKLRAEDPDSISAAEAIVDLDVRMNRPQDALQVCDEMVNRLSSVDARLLRAKTLTILDKPDKAKEDFDAVVTLEPNNADAWIARSSFHRSLGQYDQAIKDIHQAMTILPDNLQIQKASIPIFLASNDRTLREEGESILEKAVADNPGDIELGLQKTKMLLAKNTAPQIEQATLILESITERRPQTREAWALLAGLFLQDSKPARAIDACLRGLVHNPADRNLFLLKARAEAKISPDSALPTLRTLWELDPNNADSVLYLADAYAAASKYDAAIKLLSDQSASGDLSQQRRIKTAMAFALYKNNDKDLAEKMLNELRKTEPNDPRPLLAQIRLGREDRLWKRVREHAETACSIFAGKAQTVISIAGEITSERNEQGNKIAEEFLDCVLRHEPNSIPVMVRLGTLLQSLNRSQEAASIYKRILELQPDNLVAINNLAWILCEQQNNCTEALQLAERGLKIQPDWVDLIDTHGVVLYRLGQFEPAMKDFEKSVNLYPAREPHIVASYFHLGKCLAKLGEKNKAITYLKKSIELNMDIAGMADEDVAQANQLLKSLSGGEK